MPAIYAHDLFGRNVFMELDKEIRDVIRSQKDCFYLGVHGPDVLFFYRAWEKNPINQKGYDFHGRPAAEIFAHGLEVMRRTEDEEKKCALQSYLLGFACHFALDYSLHGEIDKMEHTTGFTHAQIETELDRRLLIQGGMVPVRTYTACHLKNTEMTQFVVQKILKEDEPQAKEAIFSFKTISRMFINTDEWFKEVIGIVMKALGCYDKFYGMVMRKKPTEGLKNTTDLLETMFVDAVPFGVQLVNGLYASIKKRDALPPAFWGNFEGQKGGFPL